VSSRGGPVFRFYPSLSSCSVSRGSAVPSRSSRLVTRLLQVVPSLCRRATCTSRCLQVVSIGGVERGPPSPYRSFLSTFYRVARSFSTQKGKPVSAPCVHLRRPDVEADLFGVESNERDELYLALRFCLSFHSHPPIRYLSALIPGRSLCRSSSGRASQSGSKMSCAAALPTAHRWAVLVKILPRFCADHSDQ
jgi:hypothetical protein